MGSREFGGVRVRNPHYEGIDDPDYFDQISVSVHGGTVVLHAGEIDGHYELTHGAALHLAKLLERAATKNV